MKVAVSWDECAFFRDAPVECRTRVGTLVVQKRFAAREAIFDEGDLAEHVYILSSGEVELTYTLPTRPGTTVRITVIQPGDVFAWSALTDRDHLTARAAALVDSEAYLIPAAPLKQILDQNPEFGYQTMKRLAAMIAARLRDTRSQLQWLHSM
jgi:CRP-like cAMP-binding protein